MSWDRLINDPNVKLDLSGMTIEEVEQKVAGLTNDQVWAVLGQLEEAQARADARARLVNIVRTGLRVVKLFA